MGEDRCYITNQTSSLSAQVRQAASAFLCLWGYLTLFCSLRVALVWLDAVGLRHGGCFSIVEAGSAGLLLGSVKSGSNHHESTWGS